jgi:pilus assembly protein CpaB
VKRRVLIAGLAVLLAALGAGAVLAYVHQSVASGLAGQRGTTALVAQQVIPSGTSARQAQADGLLRSERFPAATVPASAVRSLTPGVAGLVTSAQVQAGQLLLRPLLVPAAQVTGGIALPPRMVAVTMAFCLTEAVAGGVHAGSTVEIFDTTAAPGAGAPGGALTAGADCSGSHQEQAGGAAHTRVVLPEVKVLSVGPAGTGQTTSGQATTTQSSSATGAVPASGQGTVLVTFAVSPPTAQRLIQVSVAGLPYLALLQP